MTLLSARLWRENAALARQTLAHDFVRGLGDGTLPRPAFQRYVAQDAFFLEAFARAYALALARSPDRQGLWDFFELLHGVQDELRLHRSYAERWEIDITNVRPVPATSSYTDFLLATAALGTVGAICAAMSPCMRLYAFLGQSLITDREPITASNPYAEWVRTYSHPDFERLAATLERLLDRYAEDTPANQATYRKAMELELAFFEASLQGGRP